MKIIVPVDGSDYSMEALKVAVDFAKTKQANICLINVVSSIEGLDLEISAGERQRIEERMEKRAEYIVQQACGRLATEDIVSTCRHIVTAVSVPDAIIDYAEKEKADLIIMGSRGLSSSSRFRMGSVAAKVVRHSPCSVYVVKK